MSRPQTHRKSQSTSALSIIASSPSRPSRTSREKPRSGLERVEEASPAQRRGSADTVGHSPGRAEGSRGSASGSLRTSGTEQNPGRNATLADVKGWMNDVLSIRASPTRRLNALKKIEECLLQCCLGGHREGIDMTELLALNLHTSLLILLTRHSQLLTSRAHSHSSLHASDEVAKNLVPEITAVFGLLQGLCLLSATCKASCAEEWTIEMLIDLLLLLRSIPAATEGNDQSRPVVYTILELLFCMLVDSPEYSRRFEKLSGLEAVTRVLKGSSVSKDVRMKCIEFLYFYLLPEHQSRSLSSSTRSTSSTSTSTSSSDSLYPPSPLDRSSQSRQSPLIVQPPLSPTNTGDLDVAFVPQTPRKKVTPNLGYLTPSSRRVSGGCSAKSTPALHTVPASPLESGVPTPKASAPRRESEDAEVGLGLGLPNANGGGLKRDVTAIHLGAMVDSPGSGHSARSRDSQQSRPPRSPTSGKMSRSSTQPKNSGLQSSQRQTSLSIRKTSRSPLVQSSIPESPTLAAPAGRSEANSRQSRTSLYPSSDTEGASGMSDSGQAPRMRHSRTSSHLSSHADSPSSPLLPLPRTPRIRHSMTSSNFPSKGQEPALSSATGSKSPRMRHSRTSSHLSALAPDVPATPSQLSRSPSAFLIPSRTPSGGEPPRDRTPSAFLASTPSHSRLPSGGEGGMERTPSKARRAFPSELTRGLLPPPSSPKPTPLGHSRRLPSTSDRRSSLAPSGGDRVSHEKQGGEVRSVEEKKEMLGQWLGNVDALVSGVEGAGWWGAQKGR